MSEEKKDSEIIVNIHEEEDEEEEVDQYFPINLLAMNYPEYLFNNPYIPVNTNQRNQYMLNVMADLFNGLIDDMTISYREDRKDREDREDREDRMMEIAMRESLEHYKTQEKKPNIELNVDGSIATEKHKGENCVICNSEFEKDEKITNLECNHVLHTECISEWVKYKPECPICRASISVVDTKSSNMDSTD